MVRIFVIAVTAAACVLAGASAGLLAVAVELNSSLLDPDIALYGVGWSCVGVGSSAKTQCSPRRLAR